MSEQLSAPFWTVSIFLADKAYGGPEEGGWFYDTGQRCDQEIVGVNPKYLFAIFYTEAAANDWRKALQKILDDGVNVGRRSKSSVLSDGVYEAEVYNGRPPARYPAQRPFYE